MNSFVTSLFSKPIDRITDISLTCSYRLPVIEDESEKKHMNIVIAMMTLKIIVSVSSAYYEEKHQTSVKQDAIDKCY